ncbi:MAG TPA: bifunctional UDP-N-acetylglucosamine diphosphorylase/glucosamine-1-phosphate N-acetyltransferase GlmU [Solirubrobacterales bacterium]
MESPLVLVMAAGEGTRMRSSLPKMLHPVCGRPMVAWPILAAREATGAEWVVAIDSPKENSVPGLPDKVRIVIQPEPDGTGGAVRAALPLIEEAETVLVLSGDVPLISSERISGLLEAHAASGAAATMLTIELDDPGSYGRVLRDDDGGVERVVEAKAAGDATPEQLAIREINAGTYAFAAAPLADALAGLSNDNAQGEYYLPDVLPALREAGHSVAAHLTEDLAVTMGVNNRADLAAVEAEARRSILRAHMLAGVTVVDPASTWIDADVEIAPDARIEPGTSLRGKTTVGSGSTVGPLSTLTDTTLGAKVSVPHSFLVECVAGDGAQIGPFAHLRPDAELASGAKAGSFVEVKNSRIGEGAKVPHLAYVGDAEIGAGSNLGAGAITANYDGFRKNRTTIGENVRIGVDTMLIAPVEVGDGAYTGAGAVIKSDVPEGALAVSENEQRNIEGYAARKAAKMQEEQTP